MKELTELHKRFDEIHKLHKRFDDLEDNIAQIRKALSKKWKGKYKVN